MPKSPMPHAIHHPRAPCLRSARFGPPAVPLGFPTIEDTVYYSVDAETAAPAWCPSTCLPKSQFNDAAMLSRSGLGLCVRDLVPTHLSPCSVLHLGVF